MSSSLMNNDYYSLKNGKSAIDYIYKFNLSFARGNAFKYLTRASRKPNESAEKDLTKALTYILTSDDDISKCFRIALRYINRIKFNEHEEIADFRIQEILKAIILFESKEQIAKMIIDYMNFLGLTVKKEFRQYA